MWETKPLSWLHFFIYSINWVRIGSYVLGCGGFPANKDFRSTKKLVEFIGLETTWFFSQSLNVTCVWHIEGSFFEDEWLFVHGILPSFTFKQNIMQPFICIMSPCQIRFYSPLFAHPPSMPSHSTRNAFEPSTPEAETPSTSNAKTERSKQVPNAGPKPYEPDLSIHRKIPP